MSAPVTEVFVTSGDVPHFTIEQVKLDQKEIQKLDAARHLISAESYDDAIAKLRSQSEQMDPEDANFDLLKRVVARYKVLDPAMKNTARAREALVVLLLNGKPEPLTADDYDKDGKPKWGVPRSLDSDSRSERICSCRRSVASSARSSGLRRCSW